MSEPEAAQPRRVDDPAAGLRYLGFRHSEIRYSELRYFEIRYSEFGQRQRYGRRRRVPAATGHRAHRADGAGGIRNQRVDQGGLADSRLADQHADLASQE